jgi:hypothetical protein
VKAFWSRLPQHFQNIPGEFRKLVQKQHAVMRSVHVSQAWFSPIPVDQIIQHVVACPVPLEGRASVDEYLINGYISALSSKNTDAIDFAVLKLLRVDAQDLPTALLEPLVRALRHIIRTTNHHSYDAIATRVIEVLGHYGSRGRESAQTLNEVAKDPRFTLSALNALAKM